jgi:hypothetical protein
LKPAAGVDLHRWRQRWASAADFIASREGRKESTCLRISSCSAPKRSPPLMTPPVEMRCRIYLAIWVSWYYERPKNGMIVKWSNTVFLLLAILILFLKMGFLLLKRFKQYYTR